MKQFDFKITNALGDPRMARVGTITTPHGVIQTPAFIPVGTKATVKSLTPEHISEAGAQAVLANAYHLYLQPGHQLIAEAGGIHEFMQWHGPMFTDSGGFQILSLGSGFKKVISMDVDTSENTPTSSRRAFVDDDGVFFKSHLDGSMHRFTPEISMQVQFDIGADICFAFDELTSLADPYEYQVEALNRTHAWADRSVAALRQLQADNPARSYQALFGVLQGAHYEDLRRQTARRLGTMDFDGYGIGGAIEKARLGSIVRWANEELPADRPKHMLGISEPDDMFAAVEHGVDTFDCVSPTRVGRNGTAYTPTGRVQITAARFKRDFTPINHECGCYTCQHYTRAYLCHLLRAKERLGATLMSIHNEYFVIELVAQMRSHIASGDFIAFRDDWLARYYQTSSSSKQPMLGV